VKARANYQETQGKFKDNYFNFCFRYQFYYQARACFDVYVADVFLKTIN